MVEEALRRCYRRLGSRYTVFFLLTQIPAAALISFVVVAVLATYYDPSVLDVALLAAATAAFTAMGMAFMITRQYPMLTPIVQWSRQRSSAAETIEAWDAATNYPIRSFRRNSLLANAIVVLPSAVVMVWVLGLPPRAYPVVAAAGAIAAAYGSVVTYSISEFFMRPALEDIAAALPDDFQFQMSGLAVRKRLALSLFSFTAMTGLVVGAFVTDGGGTGMLLTALIGSLAVGLALSFELTGVLSRAITEPIAHLRSALAQVARGDYGVRVPVLSSDELGEVSNAFNQMAQGLAERERIREAFGTYLDKDVAGFILSGNLPADGVEADVSIMFCDVRNFTPFAERASASEIVAALNGLFETLVPVISSHGGHIDKFIGDGLLAVFGAPQRHGDHADRALAAALDILEAVERSAIGLSVCIGLNSGRVVAGSIGGAGRLDFSVIGDAVNVAARVEAATRTTGDDLLLTRATADALLSSATLSSRGSIFLKGRSDPIELFAPKRTARSRKARAPSEPKRRGSTLKI